MRPPEISNPAPVCETGNGVEIDRSGGQITPRDTGSTEQPQLLIDKHGHVHSEAVLRHWSPAALKALGIRRVEPDEPVGGAV